LPVFCKNGFLFCSPDFPGLLLWVFLLVNGHSPLPVFVEQKPPSELSEYFEHTGAQLVGCCYGAAGLKVDVTAIEAVWRCCWPQGPAASTARRREFVAGRCCAWLALQRCCGQGVWVGRGSDRSPQWPHRVVGSISHASGRAACLVGDVSVCAAVGLDIESVLESSAARALWPVLLNPDEQRFIERCGLPVGLATTLVFSAKESLFKALYPLLHVYFDFLDAQVLSLTPSQCVLQLRRPLAEGFGAGCCFEVGWFAGWPTPAMLVSWLLYSRVA
jgi:enterobactin synthetase component D